MSKIRDFDVNVADEYLDTPETIAAYLSDAFETGEDDLIAQALGVVAGVKAREERETALDAARISLASEVRDKLTKIGKDLGKNAEEFTAPESPWFVSRDTVVEFLEELIEGDQVIDDPAIHRWFRNKLTEHRELEMKIDQP